MRNAFELTADEATGGGLKVRLKNLYIVLAKSAAVKRHIFFILYVH